MSPLPQNRCITATSPKTGMQKKRQEATHPFCLHTQCRNSECGLVPLWTTRPPARETPGPPMICPPPAGTVCVPPVSQDPLSPMPWHRPGLAGCARGTSLREAGSSCSPPRCSRPWTLGREVQATVSTAPNNLFTPNSQFFHCQFTFSLPIHNLFHSQFKRFSLPIYNLFTPNLQLFFTPIHKILTLNSQEFHSQVITFSTPNSQTFPHQFHSQFTFFSLPIHKNFHSHFTTFSMPISFPIHNRFTPNSPFSLLIQSFSLPFTRFSLPIHNLFTPNS